MAGRTDQTTGPGVTASLARHAVEAAYDDATRRLAMQAFLDTVPVMVAGLVEQESEAILAYGRQCAGNGRSAILGVGSGHDAPTAALVNGTLAHVLDYDDVSYAVKGHPSAVLVPALLATAAATDASGPAVLDAYLAAFDVGVGVARAFDIVRHYRQGWHATSTVGVLEAAAAAGRLMGLDEMQMRQALAMAASFACGSRQNFGSATKSLHVGHAARAGVEAAQLVRAGATADPAQLEGPLGYLALFGDDPDPESLRRSLDGGPAVTRDAGLISKLYPCCYHAHRAADAARILHGRLGDAVPAEVQVSVDPGGVSSLIYPDPGTPLQAKFSGPFIVAAALTDGRVGFDTFTTEALARDDLRRLQARVRFVEEPRPPIGPTTWSTGYAAVRVTTADGDVLEERVDIPRGDPRNPLSEADRRDKLEECLGRAGYPERAQTLFDDVSAMMDDRPTSGILDRLVA